MKRASAVRAMLGVLCPLLVVCLVGALSGCAAAAPDPHGISAAARKSVTEDYLNGLWQQVQPGDPTFHRPRTHIIEYVNYLDAASILEACMAKAGYKHTTWGLTTGVIDTALAPVDRFPVEVATFTCEAEYPTEPQELGYLSDAQEEYVYYYWSNESVPCLRAHDVKIANLPPVGEFGEGYEDVAELNPFIHLNLPHGLKEPYLLALCPPYPGELYPSSDAAG